MMQGTTSLKYFFSNYNIAYQTNNNVSIYSTLTRKYSLNTLFFFFCLLFSLVGVSLVRLQQQSANIIGLHFTPYLSSVWEIFRWNFSLSSSETAHIFS